MRGRPAVPHWGQGTTTGHRSTPDDDIGDLNQARYHWDQALTIYGNLGVPETNNVQIHLTRLDQIDDTRTLP